MPQIRIIPKDGRVLTDPLNRGEFPPATVKRYVSLDELKERLIEFQNDWLQSLEETGENPQAVEVNLFYVIDDIAEMMGIDWEPIDEPLDIKILSMPVE